MIEKSDYRISHEDYTYLAIVRATGNKVSIDINANLVDRDRMSIEPLGRIFLEANTVALVIQKVDPSKVCTNTNKLHENII